MSKIPGLRTSKTILRLLAFLGIAALIATCYHNQIWIARPLGSELPDPKPARCLADQQENIALVVKTGTSEAFDKLPIQLETSLSCAENMLIVSDLDLDIAGYRLHDVLANVSAHIREQDPAFEIYRHQLRLQDAGESALEATNAKAPHNPDHNAAWNLDKFKFLHMLNKAQQEVPGKDWYVFIEADSYLIWPNLISWLQQLDARKELYIGSPSFLGGIKFNHGGSGFVLSGPALRAFAVEHPTMAEDWDERTSTECCGDFVLTLAMNELGIPVSGAWPMLSGERPLEIPFGPALWCQPIVTLHHMTTEDVGQMWTFEKDFDKWNRPMMFQDLYHHWLPQGLPRYRKDWDNRCPGSVFNIADPNGVSSGTSLDACSQACEGIPYCMQFLYRENECKLYKCFTLGKSVAPSDGKSWHSVWRTDRIDSWLDEHATCTTAEWVPYSTENARHGGIA